MAAIAGATMVTDHSIVGLAPGEAFGQAAAMCRAAMGVQQFVEELDDDLGILEGKSPANDGEIRGGFLTHGSTISHGSDSKIHMG